MHIYVYRYTYIYIYMLHIHMTIREYVYTTLYKYIYIYIYTQYMYIYIYMYIYMYIYIYVYTYVYTYINTYIRRSLFRGATRLRRSIYSQTVNQLPTWILVLAYQAFAGLTVILSDSYWVDGKVQKRQVTPNFDRSESLGLNAIQPILCLKAPKEPGHAQDVSKASEMRSKAIPRR